MNYFSNLLPAFSQLGNALGGGHHDISISARTGYMSADTNHWWWRFSEKVIDFAFYPFDGEGHCWKAFRKDKGENYKYRTGGILGLVFVGVLQMFFSILIAAISWTYQGIKSLINIIKKF